MRSSIKNFEYYLSKQILYIVTIIRLDLDIISS